MLYNLGLTHFLTFTSFPVFFRLKFFEAAFLNYIGLHRAFIMRVFKLLGELSAFPILYRSISAGEANNAMSLLLKLQSKGFPLLTAMATLQFPAVVPRMV